MGTFVLYLELKLKFYSIKAEESYGGVGIAAIWKAYLNVGCTERACKLCIKKLKDFALSGKPGVDAAF